MSSEKIDIVAPTIAVEPSLYTARNIIPPDVGIIISISSFPFTSIFSEPASIPLT